LKTLSWLSVIIICLIIWPTANVSRQLEELRPVEIEMESKHDTRTFEDLCRNDPVAALAESLRRYREQVAAYHCRFIKQERINGKLLAKEIISCAFREKPFSVLMDWVEGAVRAEKILFVDGENENELQIRVKPLLPKGFQLVPNLVVSRPITHPDARNSSRYSIVEFGIGKSTERTYAAWKAAHDRSLLHFQYLGIQSVPELSNLPCHLIRRKCNPPEEEGLTEVTIYLDAKSGFQVGSVLKVNQELLGSYFFADLELNTRMAENQFKAEILKK
jgi:hypothetical protein